MHDVDAEEREPKGSLRHCRQSMPPTRDVALYRFCPVALQLGGQESAGFVTRDTRGAHITRLWAVSQVFNEETE